MRVRKAAPSTGSEDIVGTPPKSALAADSLGRSLLLAALLWWAIGWGLAPLRNMAAVIRARHADSLQPLQLEPLPSELAPMQAALNRLLGQIEQLLERERRRTDRTPAPAHAQRQHAGIHRHFPHDFSIDTSEDAPRKCAMRLISLLPGEFLP